MAEGNSGVSRISGGSIGVWALVALLASAMLGVRLGDKSDKPVKPAERPSAETRPEENASKAGGAAHREFLARFLPRRPAKPKIDSPEKSKSGTTGPEEPATPEPLNLTDGYTLDVIIATVPDPIDTPFGSMFDHLVESLGRMVGDTGIFDPFRQYLPWEEHARATKPSDRRPSSAADPARVTYRTEPGVLLFRCHTNPKSFLAILLVGETPRGMHWQAMTQALQLAAETEGHRAHRDWKESKGHTVSGRDTSCEQHTPAEPKIRMIAPAFTGTMPTLVRAIHEWKAALCPVDPAQQLRIDMISGSANGFDRAYFGNLTNKFPGGKCIDVHSTIAPNAVQTRAAIDFLKHRSTRNGVVPPKESQNEYVAMLVESNTGFGRSQSERPDRNKSVGTANPHHVRTPWPILLPFPMHLSRLQAAAEKERRDMQRLIDPKSSSAPDGETQWARARSDTVPTMDDQETSEFNARALDDLMAMIRLNHVQIVGITATDPHDAVFLVGKVKQACPEVEIFVTSADLLFTQPYNRSMMHDVVIATTYPLIPANVGWTDPNEDRWQGFKLETGVAYYNAAAFHLADIYPGQRDKLGNWLQEYRLPVFAETSVGPALPNYPLQMLMGGALATVALAPIERPPIWITTVGNDGEFVPYGFYRIYDDELLMKRGVPTGESPMNQKVLRPPMFTLRMLAAIVSFAGLLLLGYIVAAGRSRESRGGRSNVLGIGRVRLVFGGSVSQSLEYRSFRNGFFWHLLFPSMFFCLAPFVLLEIAIYLEFAQPPGQALGFQIAALGLVVAMALMMVWCGTMMAVATIYNCCGLAYCTSARSLRFRRLQTAIRLIAMAGIFVAIWFVCYESAGHLASVSRSNRMLFLWRQVSLASGQSWLPPFLLAVGAIVVFALYGLRRIVEAQDGDIGNPFPVVVVGNKLVQGSCHRIAAITRKLRRDLVYFAEFLIGNWKRLAVPIGTLIVWCASIAVMWRPGWESERWCNLLGIFGYVYLLLLTATLVRFWCAWKSVDALLKEIALLPMVGAFDRLPQKVSTLLGGYFFQTRPKRAHLAIPFHQLRQLLRLAENSPALAGAVADWRRDGIDNRFDRLADADARRVLPEDTAEDADLREITSRLCATSRAIVRELVPYWTNRSAEQAFGATAATSVSDTQSKTPIQDLAEEFVAVMTIIFLGRLVRAARQLVWPLVIGSICLVLAASSYPFRPERPILFLVVTLLIAICGTIAYVMYQMNKNELYSRIMRSTPNTFTPNWEFVANLVVTVGPIAIILIARLSGGLRDIVEPLLGLLK